MTEQALEDLDEDAKTALADGEFHPSEMADDDDENYGRRVSKRIGKEVGKRKRIESELEAERAERAREHKELMEARDRLSAYEKQQHEDQSGKVEDLRKKAKQALDDGDLDTYHDLNEELSDVKFALRMREAQPKQEPVDDYRDDGPKISDEASNWVASNSWFGKDKARTQRAQALEKALVAEGYSVTDPSLYDELDARLDGGDEADDEPPPRNNHRRGMTGAGVNRDSYDENPGRNSRKLTRSDLAAMARNNFDPDNPAHRRAWIKRNDELS